MWLRDLVVWWLYTSMLLPDKFTRRWALSRALSAASFVHSEHSVLEMARLLASLCRPMTRLVPRNVRFAAQTSGPVATIPAAVKLPLHLGGRFSGKRRF